MKILALDTATAACSAALFIDGDITRRYRLASRGHAELILPMLDELLAEADLTPSQCDLLAFGRGPGAFTGLRIAAGVTQGIAFATDLPVLPVSTLAALALRAYRERELCRVAAAFDARMGEVYWGLYRCDDGLPSACSVEQVVKPDQVALPQQPDGWAGVGDGWAAHADTLSRRLAVDTAWSDCYPRAEEIALIAASGDVEPLPAEQALPVYLRDTVATPPQGPEPFLR